MLMIDGKPMGHDGVNKRRNAGAAFVPEERLGRGAVPEMSLAENAEPDEILTDVAALGDAAEYERRGEPVVVVSPFLPAVNIIGKRPGWTSISILNVSSSGLFGSCLS